MTTATKPRRTRSEIERDERRAKLVKAQQAWDKLFSQPGVQKQEYLDTAHAEAYQDDADRLHTVYSYLVEDLERAIRYEQGKLDKFRAELDKNAYQAFYWGTAALDAAATVAVYTDVLELIKNKGPVLAHKVVLQQVLRGARYVTRSTAPLANLIEQSKTTAWAEALEILERWSR